MVLNNIETKDIEPSDIELLTYLVRGSLEDKLFVVDVTDMTCAHC